MADELVDVCDEDDNLLPSTIMKSLAHKKGVWHRAAHIWIYNSNGEILLQLRSKSKSVFPCLWDISAAGHVGAGEEPITAGIRELNEELGITVKKENLHFFTIKKVQTHYQKLTINEFYHVYLLLFNCDVKKLKLQNEEVQSTQFLSLKKVEEELHFHPQHYVPHGEYWFEVLKEVKKKLKHSPVIHP